MRQYGLDVMNGETLRRTVIIQNPQGFHMRPASAFAQLASQFQCSVRVSKDEQTVNGKSALELMMLGAAQGVELTVEASGPDAQGALDALLPLLAAPSLDEETEPPLPAKG